MNQVTRGRARVGKLIVSELNVTTKSQTGTANAFTLTPEELMSNIIFLTGTPNGGFNVIFNVAYKNFYTVINKSGQTATLKNAAGNTTTVADGAVALVQNTGVDMVALTGQSGTQVTLDGAQVLTNKTLTDVLIDDGDAGVKVTSADQTNAGATVTIPDIGDAADEFLMKDTAQTVTLKTIDGASNTVKNIVHAYAGNITRAEMVAGKTLVAARAGMNIKVLSIKMKVNGAFNGGAGTSFVLKDTSGTVTILTALKAALTDGAKISTEANGMSADVTEGAGMVGALTAANGIAVVADAAWNAGTGIDIVIQYMYV